MRIDQLFKDQGHFCMWDKVKGKADVLLWMGYKKTCLDYLKLLY